MHARKVTAMMLAVLTVLGTTAALPGPSTGAPDVILDGQTRIYANGTFTLRGSVEILSGGALVIDNATMIVSAGPWVVHANPGARFEMKTSRMFSDELAGTVVGVTDQVNDLAPALGDTRYRIQIDDDASYLILNSEIANGQAVVIAGGSGVILGATFRNNTVAVTSTGLPGVTILKSSFFDNGIGVDVVDGAATILDSVLYNGSTCIRDSGSHVTYKRLEIHSCLTGIREVSSVSTIQNNMMVDRNDPLGKALDVTNTQATIEGNDIHRWGIGIAAEGGQLQTRNNTLNDTDAGIRANGVASESHRDNLIANSTVGMALLNSTATVATNRFLDNGIGLDLYQGAPRVLDNQMHRGEVCARDERAGDAHYERNLFSACGIGLYAANGTSRATNNTFRGVSNATGTGLLARGTNVTAERNAFEKWAVCIDSRDSYVVLENNTFTECGLGVDLYGSRGAVKSNVLGRSPSGIRERSANGPVTIASNRVNGTGFSGTGISASSAGSTLESNVVSNFSSALGGSSMVARNNSIRDVIYGLNGGASVFTGNSMRGRPFFDGPNGTYSTAIRGSVGNASYNSFDNWTFILDQFGAGMWLGNHVNDSGNVAAVTTALGNTYRNASLELRGNASGNIFQQATLSSFRANVTMTNNTLVGTNVSFRYANVTYARNWHHGGSVSHSDGNLTTESNTMINASINVATMVAPATAILRNDTITNGNVGISHAIAVMEDLTIRNSQTGISLTNSSATVRAHINNTFKAIVISSGCAGPVRIHNSTLDGRSANLTGVEINGACNATIERSSILGFWTVGGGGGVDARSASSFADARNNWWGAASGPFNAVSNPSGTGARVSPRVLFSPWLLAPPT